MAKEKTTPKRAASQTSHNKTSPAKKKQQDVAVGEAEEQKSPNSEDLKRSEQQERESDGAARRQECVVAKPQLTLAETSPDHFLAILSLLRASTGQDFSRYKRGTLTRRIDRRMGIRQISRPADYLKLLREDQEELQDLFKDLLIGVTRFFRDSQVWDDLGRVLFGEIQQKREDDPFRVWVPGCASGEEAYSIAMLLFEQQQRQNRRLDLQVFATDIDVQAIDAARLGIYRENITKDVVDTRLDIYFQREGGRLRVRKKLRETCIFAAQNLLSDPPFSNLDLISCRNLLIYLEADVQRRIFDMLHFALKPGGVLLLGTSESPAKRKHLFEVLSQSSRIYRKIGESKPGSGRFPLDGGRSRSLGGTIRESESVVAKDVGTVELSRRALLEEFAPASVVVNQRGIIQFIHGAIRHYLDFPSGEPDLDLAAMAQEGLKAKTRTAFQRARLSNETVSVVAPRVKRNGSYLTVRIRVHPLPTAKDSESLFLVSFLDEMPAAKVVTTKPDDAGGPSNASQAGDGDPSGGASSGNGDLVHQLEVELQATREDLQSTIEELESANEELKASNEEVMSMNEELQSTNEELQTSREELQSLNEELRTVNNQLHDKVEEQEATTNDLTNLLASTDMATLFLDSDLRIRRYTPATSRLMNILETDIGRPISDLSSRVNDSDLVSDARQVLEQLSPIEKEVHNGGPKWFMRRVMPFRTSDNKIEGVVVTFNNVTSMKDAARRLQFRERQQAVIAQLGRAALAGEDVQTLCERAAREIVETLDVDLCKILRMEPNGNQLRLVAGVGWPEEQIGTATEPAGIESVAGYTLQTSGPIIVNDLAKEKRFSNSALLASRDAVSGVSVIIGPEEAPWGTLGAFCRQATEFTIDDSHFVFAVANVIWEAIRRKTIESELRDSEARTAAFLNNSAVVSWMKDEQGRYTYLSPNYLRCFDATLEDWLGRTDDELWPSEIAERFRANDLRVLQSNEAVEDIEEAVCPDGREAYFLSLKFPFTDGSGRRFVGGLGVDITARIQAEQQRDRERAMLKAVLEAMPAGVVIADTQGRITHHNAAANELWGIPPETKSWKDYQDWVAWWPETGERIKAEEWAMTRALLGGEVTRNELIQNQRFHSDQRRFYLNNVAPVHGADGRILGGVGAMLDVTDRIESEQALADSELRLRLAASMAGFGTYHSDIEANVVTWSPEMKRIFGLNAKDPVPIRVGDVPQHVHEGDRQRVAEKIKASLDPTGEGRFQDEHRIVRPDGEIRWVLMLGRTAFKGKGSNRRAVRNAGIALDITNRHRAEEELEAARRAAEAASEAKTIFLANMSHEIRTPMTAILGYAEVLQSRLNDPDAQACLNTIKENGDYLCDILNDILDLSKIESGKMVAHLQSCSPVEMLADVRSLMTVRATAKSLTLSIDFEGEIPSTVQSDTKMVRQVLVNLVGNAIKFTDCGGVRIVTRCLAEQEMLEIDVIDTGIGIDREQLDALFLPFEQLDNSFTRTAGGSGLGLAISRKLVEMLGGEITVDSTPGKGSTFRFTIQTGSLTDVQWTTPDASELCREKDTKENAADQFPSISGSVLAVDDRPEIRFLVRQFVESAGGEIQTAENGRQAVDAWIACRNGGAPIDAIIMDIQMPVMDGFEATRMLRAEGYEGPIIALTANALRRDRNKCLEAGCNDFISKPIDRVELLQKLADCLSDSSPPRSSASDDPMAVLCVDDHESTCQLQKLVLEQRGFRVVTAMSGEEALEAIGQFTPQAALIDLGLKRMSGAELLQQLKTKPELGKCLFVCISGRDESDVAWRDIGFDHYLRKPADVDDIERILAQARR